MKEDPKADKRLEHHSEWKVCVYDPSEAIELTEDNCYVELSDKESSAQEETRTNHGQAKSAKPAI